MKSHGQLVQRRPPSFGTGQLVGFEREQLLNLEAVVATPAPAELAQLQAADRNSADKRHGARAPASYRATRTIKP